MRMGKNAKGSNILLYLLIGAVVVQLTGIYDIIGLFNKAPAPTPVNPIANPTLCPTDGDASVKIDVRNELNTTVSEPFDVTMYLYDSSGALFATVTDTTSPTATTVNCGDSFVGKVVASDSNGGDNSRITGKDFGDVTVNADGTIVFKVERSNVNIGLKGRKHGVLQFKSYDNDAAGWMCDSDDLCTAYEGDGVTFESTTNASAKAIAAGGLLDITINVQGTMPTTDFQDAYVLVAIEGGASALTIWEDPNSVTWNGKAIAEVSSQLTPEEVKALNAYEWVYKIEGPIEDNVNQLRIQMAPASGQDPTADMEVDFYSAGKYLSVDGKSVKEGAARDDTSYTVTYTVQDITYNLS